MPVLCFLFDLSGSGKAGVGVGEKVKWSRANCSRKIRGGGVPCSSEEGLREGRSARGLPLKETKEGEGVGRTPAHR